MFSKAFAKRMALIICLIWSLLTLDGVHGGNDGNDFGVRESPLSLYEMQGARQVNKFTRGGLYRATFNERSAISTYVISPLKMGIYIEDSDAALEYAINAAAIGQQTRRTGVNCSGADLFDVQGKLYGNFFAMKIKTKRLLSEERCESYLLHVEAKVDKRTVDTTRVFIQARMSANFEPRFNKTRISETIPSNFPLSQPIIQLKTKDVRDWGKVYYSLQQESKYFVLNPINGFLFLKQSLPLGINTFNLVAAVTKWDSKPNLQTFIDNACQITIKVTDANKYAPTIDVKVLEKPVAEVNKQAIAILTVSDKDQGKNGKIDELKMISGNEGGDLRVVRVDPDSGNFKLYVVKSLDCHRCLFRITFKATDKGNPPMSVAKVHYFSLKNPIFKNNSFIEDEYFVDVSEVMPVGYTIIDLTPPTLGMLSNISCTIVKGDTLIVPENTCKIKLGAPLDALVRSSYVMRVSYKITGRAIESGSTIVHVNVIDFNNHGPAFVSKNHYVEISEDMALHADVYQVKVKDGDVGDSGKLTYWLMNRSSQFKIDPNTGMISVKQVSDRDNGTPEFAYLVVRVADNGSPFRREGETVVTIRIKARNDNAPVIKQDSCRMKLSSSTSVGTRLVQIEAFDRDVGSNSQISYSLISGNTNSLFAIDSSSGYVTLARPLSSTHTSFTLLVSAHDGTQKSQNNAVLRITIADQLTRQVISCTESNLYRTLTSKPTMVAKNPVKPVITSNPPSNTYAPEFDEKVLTITVAEDVKVGSVLTTLKAVDKDNGYEGWLTYYIVDGNNNNGFDVDALTGDLRLVAVLSRENGAKIELNISAWDSGVSRKVGFVKVVITIKDVNDNPPKFSQDFYNVSVSENLPPGTIVELISKHIVVGQGFTFQLVNDYNKLFSVDFISTRGLTLKTDQQLDFEAQKLYEIQVLALDGSLGNQPISLADIIVNVQDVNDNHPIVYNPNQHVIIMRDLPVGSPITQIIADDVDSGGALNFALIRSFGSDHFSIDSNTGLIKLSSSLTGQAQESYNLSVVVSDGDKTSLTTTSYVNILVIQRTGSQSLKMLTSHSEISQFDINENLAPGQKIAELGGDDISVSKRSNYVFSIIDGTDVTVFNIDGTSGWLKTAKSLDHEEVPYYWLTIQVVNKQSKQFHSILQVLIKVGDENDNGPIFYPPVYESKIPENTIAGEVVAALTANDADSGKNGNVSYAIIQGNDKGHFVINAVTGIITTTDKHLDFEDQRMFRLLVSATDGGNQQKTSQATVTIYVQDENDNKPEFPSTLFSSIQFSMSGRASLPSNTLLGEVLASDKDSGKNGALTFAILRGNTGGKLRIDAKSGQLYNNVPISDANAFLLVIEAKDGGQPALSSTTSVTVLDASGIPFGKNPPKFPKKVQEITLFESTPVGHKIAIPPAIDKDYDSLSYLIYAGNEEQKFMLEKHQNQLKVFGELKPPSYRLVIGASDGLYSDNVTVIINVNDINNHYPIPQMIEKIATLPENAHAGTKVTKVSASDLDFGDNARLRYAFKFAAQPKSLGLFSLDEDSGEIVLAGKLDYEDIKKHVLTVEIKDRSAKPKESLMYVVVNVDDVNEWEPVFVKPFYEVYIQENLPRGSDVIKVIAQDPDHGWNGLLKYSIASGNQDYAFSIRPQSGIIQTNRMLAASDISDYFLSVEVRDDGSYGLTATVNVTIHLQRNGYKSGFAKSVYLASVYENEPVNTYVTSVNFNGLMAVYTIIEESACVDSFLINPFTGVISTKEILDSEVISFCSLRVKAQDGSGFAQEVTVDVAIKNRNDNSPIAESDFFTGYIEENSSEDKLILTAKGHPLVVAARDRDIQHSQLKYQIINSAVRQYFKIDESTGEIRTTKVSLDYETRQTYRLLVEVSDHGAPSLSTITNVIIHVKNVNDIKPQFSSSTIEVHVYLPVYKDVHITTLIASDRDNLGSLEYAISQQDTPSLLGVENFGGRVFIKEPLKAQKGWYNAAIQVSDGIWTGSAKLRVVFKAITPTTFQFSEPYFQTHARENTSEVQTVFTPFVRGYNVWERLRFSLGNFEDIFTMQESTGVVKTKPGVVLDREAVTSYRLITTVQDERTPPRVARCVVTVVVDDVNDCIPTFPPPPIFFVVSNRAQPGTTVATVAASDCDSGENAKIRYQIKKDDRNMFSIDPNSAALSVLNQLDGLATPAEFTLTIEAKDSGEIPLKSEAEVSVRIESGDACIFEKPSYTVDLPENTATDKVFKQLHARCPNGKPVFSIVSGDNFSQFECDVNSGELSLLSELDFEEIPGYTLSVRAQDSKTGASSLATVHVSVQDINDNPPEIKASPYFVKVKESAPVGTSLLRVYTSDKDSGVNQELSYHIISDTSKIPGSFIIIEDTGILRVNKALDYETQKRCDLVVRVTDHGVPSLFAETMITVLIQDVNDHAPVFQRSQYQATVMENGGPSHFITQVVAKDTDESDISKLKYSIVPGFGTRYFRIDEKSGVVSLSEVSGITLGKVYTLKISVFDGNHTAYTKLDVVVGQSNNHPPKFQKDVYEAQVPENYPADSYVAMVTATDQDSGKFGEVTYAIDSPALTIDFKIDPKTGIITTKGSLDRELLSSVTIPVRASDAGGETTICNVKVKILDENDNQPRFLMPSYIAVVSASNTSVGESVVRVTAVDPDDGVNGALTYGLVGQRSPYVFGIDASSGIVSFLRKPMESLYDFYVRANDNGYLKLKSYTPVRVYIQNILFKFKKPHYSLTFSETVQGPVRAWFTIVDDQGLPITSDIDYSIEIGNNVRTNKNQTFTITSTGQLQVSQSLDYETVRSYDLTIRANRSMFSTYAVVHVDVLDANDNKPEFESDLYTVNVPENAARGRNIVQVRAHDKDTKENALISYHLSSESIALSDTFAVDSNTGWLSVNGSLDRESVPSYIVKIVAKDHGRDISLNDTISVKILIDDINDCPPVFSQQIYRVSIREDLPVYSSILTLNTTDKDINSHVIYYIVQGDLHNKFDIDQASRKIYLSAKLDREMFPRYLLNITAFDGAFTASALVEMEITDVNDNQPICEQSSLRLSVFEDLAVGSPIVTINASDSDADNNSKIIFRTHSHPDIFGINKDEGTLILKHGLDREKKSSYNLLVSASDGDSSCYTNLTIDILDVNDCVPKFTKPRYIKLIAVDAKENAFLLRVEAIDKDIGVNRKIGYAFANTSTANLFTIEKETGVILLKHRLLRRDEEKFAFNVIATDGGVPSLSSIASVEIIVSTIENCPFVQDVYKEDISEHVKPPFEVDTVSVTCSNSKDFTIVYRILSELDKIHELFKIDETTGKISLSSALDYETTRAHIFTVEALMKKPSGKSILISSASVKVKVLDYNDNKPIFSRRSYKATVKEGSDNGTIVIPLSASDNDTSSQLYFTIIKSTPNDCPFVVDASNGIVSVQGELDYERVGKYELVVRVQDDGNPPLFSDVNLVINVKDLNDNPPVVETQIKMLLRTGTRSGSIVFRLKPTDKDGPTNSKPFRFSIISGGNDAFRLNSSSGVLLVRGALTQPNITYHMTLQTVDSGSPALSAQTLVEITLVKPTVNPPDVQPITAYVNMRTGKFTGGIVGKIIVNNRAKGTILQFTLLKGNPAFSIGSEDGSIRMLSELDSGSYHLQIQVTDGTYKVNSQVIVHVKEITPDVVNNSVTVRITGKTLRSFVSTSLSAMIDTLANIKSCALEDVYLWSMQSSPKNMLDIVFAVKRKGKEQFFSPNDLRETLEDQLQTFQRLSKVDVSSVGLSPCDKGKCPIGKDCRNIITMLDEWSILIGDKTIFLSYKNEQSSECVCPEGVSDAKCSVSTPPECLDNPCKLGFTCLDRPTGYQCVCPAGANCRKDCHGNKCHKNAMTFKGNSYVRYSLHDKKTKISSFSVSLRTTKPSGTIFLVKGESDYFTLEIVEGKIRARFDYGSGEGVGIIEQVKVNDGKWHDLEMKRKGRNVRLTLDSGEYMQETVAPGSMSFLNVHLNNIIIGGELPKGSRRSVRGVSNGYFGCMESPRLNGQDLSLSNSNPPGTYTAKGVTNNCSIDICHASFCQNDGVCKMNNEEATCECKPGFTSRDCSKDIDECMSSPCKNSAKCINVPGSFKCDCNDSNFNGVLCDTRVAAVTRTESFGTREFIFIGATACAIIILTVIIVIVCRCCHKRRRKAKAARQNHEHHEMKMKAEPDEEMPPPPPPPRRGGDPDDPPTRLGSRAPSWDYADLPEMRPGKLKTFCGSDDYLDDPGEYSGTSGVPQVPRRPRQTGGVPDVPKKPAKYRCSRASSQSSVRSQSIEGVSEIGEEGLAFIRQGTKELELFTKAADVVDNLLGTKCASMTSDDDAQSECSQLDTQGHLETYDDNEVAYFIPDNDMRDSISNSEHEDETSTMLQKLPSVADSRGKILHKESSL